MGELNNFEARTQPDLNTYIGEGNHFNWERQQKMDRHTGIVQTLVSEALDNVS